MSGAETPIRNISDTARWAAAYRALETERPDAVFSDPLARRLAGEEGHKAFESFPSGERHSWAWVTRTWLFDHFIKEQVAQGVDLVVNLAAGLDARPYRMDLPPSLKWVEVDLPELLAYKEEVLKGERARCEIERVALDLSEVGARRALFERLGRAAWKVLAITEGLLIYLSAEEVGELARDLGAAANAQRWVLDLTSPGLLRMLQKQIGRKLSAVGAPFKFGPEEGPGFFVKHGWRRVEVRSLLKSAARLKRLTPFMRLLALLPDSRGEGGRPWGGVCLMERA